MNRLAAKPSILTLPLPEALDLIRLTRQNRTSPSPIIGHYTLDSLKELAHAFANPPQSLALDDSFLSENEGELSEGVEDDGALEDGVEPWSGDDESDPDD